jgi:hypothetical protein
MTNAFDRPVPTLKQQQQYLIDAVNSEPAQLFPSGPDDMDGGVDLCHICADEADGTCTICDRPVCDEDARMKDYDRFCTVCAPMPAGA